MKFAKELERELVPEWRAKYLNYKAGKQKLKAVRRALRTVNHTPRTPRHRRLSALGQSIANSTNRQSRATSIARRRAGEERLGSHTSAERDPSRGASSAYEHTDGLSNIIPEEQPLRETPSGPGGLRRYGSIIGSPPASAASAPQGNTKSKPPFLQLPDPALDPDPISPTQPQPLPKAILDSPLEESSRPTHSAYEVGETKSPTKVSAFQFGHSHAGFHVPKRAKSMPQIDRANPIIKRFMSFGGGATPGSPSSVNVPLGAVKELDLCQAEFFNFLDAEYEKIESFYKRKEAEATERLLMLREQLHIMRDCRLEELVAIQAARRKHKEARAAAENPGNGTITERMFPSQDTTSQDLLQQLDTALEAAKGDRRSKKIQAMTTLGTPLGERPRNIDDQRDYTRRRDNQEIPYRSAKRKLKIALQEYYRGLELLKSYALLNRTAFRKIVKKYDKTVNAKPPGRYVAEKVNKAWFVQSEVLDGHLRSVEDLYARYFEQGNHKIAVGKLRVKTARRGSYSSSTFRNGVMLTAGAMFAGFGLGNVVELFSETSDELFRLSTMFLLQIYAGYFLLVLLVLLFCIDCRAWVRNKINYVFVFEFDTRHHLDWRQITELPCFFFMLEGFFLWLNFRNADEAEHIQDDVMYHYWPVVLIGLSAVFLFLPFKVLYYRSRVWFLYSNWRLLLSGVYPVEFRDFFLGDMFCSQTYSMGNIASFFCLYRSAWGQEIHQCGSADMRVLGFLTTLPGIWRALQCIRRFYDTQNVFPHLVNLGKYSATILFYVSLSIWRIDGGLDRQHPSFTAFIFFATLNALYCSIWDVFMDWSLGDWTAPHPFLRDVLGYKPAWLYYVAMILDPILRFNWVLYTISYASDKNWGAFVAFIVAFSEVGRRGMWTIFRVENEHCTNVGRFRASRDVPLPYDVSTPATSQYTHTQTNTPEHPLAQDGTTGETTAVDLEAARTHESSASTAVSKDALRRRRRPSPGRPAMIRGLSRIGTIVKAAHAQDFERRTKPGVDPRHGTSTTQDDDSDDEDEARGSSDDWRDEEDVAVAASLVEQVDRTD